MTTPAPQPREIMFTVEYEGRPMCVVRAVDFREALDTAVGFLACLQAPRAEGVGSDVPRFQRPPADECAKLRARRATDREKYEFARKSFAPGGNANFAGVMLG